MVTPEFTRRRKSFDGFLFTHIAAQGLKPSIVEAFKIVRLKMEKDQPGRQISHADV